MQIKVHSNSYSQNHWTQIVLNIQLVSGFSVRDFGLLIGGTEEKEDCVERPISLIIFIVNPPATQLLRWRLAIGREKERRKCPPC
jgi:hypothetical protein